MKRCRNCGCTDMEYAQEAVVTLNTETNRYEILYVRDVGWEQCADCSSQEQEEYEV